MYVNCFANIGVRVNVKVMLLRRKTVSGINKWVVLK